MVITNSMMTCLEPLVPTPKSAQIETQYIVRTQISRFVHYSWTVLTHIYVHFWAVKSFVVLESAGIRSYITAIRWDLVGHTSEWTVPNVFF